MSAPAWPHPPADPGIHYTCHISTVYSHTTLAKSLITACCVVFFTCRSRGVFGKLSLSTPARWPLTCLRCCAVGGLTHLRTQVFTTLATLAPFIHTPRLLSLITACFCFFYLPQSRCVREVSFVYSCSVAGGLTHLRTQVFTLATLAPFIHTTLAKSCHITTVYSHTTLAKSLITACFFFFTCRSRVVVLKPCVREVVFVDSCSVASPV